MNLCQYAKSHGLGNGGNAALALEELIVLYLVKTILMDMKGAEEGKIVINMDCR